VTGPRPRCGHRWLTEATGSSHPGYDAVTAWHVCILPPGQHDPPLHECDEKHTTPQETAVA
jgi:hypothetical protein